MSKTWTKIFEMAIEKLLHLATKAGIPVVVLTRHEGELGMYANVTELEDIAQIVCAGMNSVAAEALERQEAAERRRHAH